MTEKGAYREGLVGFRIGEREVIGSQDGRSYKLGACRPQDWSSRTLRTSGSMKEEFVFPGMTEMTVCRSQDSRNKPKKKAGVACQPQRNRKRRSL